MFSFCTLFFLNFFFNCLALNHIGVFAKMFGCGKALPRRFPSSHLCVTPLCFPCSFVSCIYTVAALATCFIVGYCSLALSDPFDPDHYPCMTKTMTKTHVCSRLIFF